MSLLLATQITAAATSVLALFAVVTSVFAYLAFRAQAAEVQLLQRERRREAIERRRAQASKIILWEHRITTHAVGRQAEDSVTANLRNASELPIYDVRFAWQIDGATQAWIDRGTPLLPGETDSDSKPVPIGPPHAFGTCVEFRDAAGVRWQLKANGSLNEDDRPSAADIMRGYGFGGSSKHSRQGLHPLPNLAIGIYPGQRAVPRTFTISGACERPGKRPDAYPAHSAAQPWTLPARHR
jgi:hypothetical protein